MNNEKKETPKEVDTSTKTDISDEAPFKPVERRRSKIFEQAEKFQNMISANESKTNHQLITEKPKKIVIPGVSVGGFKKEFERRASLTSTSPPKLKTPLTKKSLSVDKSSTTTTSTPTKQAEEKQQSEKVELKETKECVKTSPVEDEEQRKIKLKNAVNIISQALDKEGARKSKSRPCMRKPPVPFGVGGRSASGSIAMLMSPLSPSSDNLRLQVLFNFIYDCHSLQNYLPSLKNLKLY